MPEPLIVALPPGLDLWGGCILRVNAIDPATGNSVAGVNVSNITFQVDLRASGDEGKIGRVLLTYVP